MKSGRSVLMLALAAVVVGGSCRVGYDGVSSGGAAGEATTGGSSGEAGGDAEGGSSRGGSSGAANGGSSGASGGTDSPGGEAGNGGASGGAGGTPNTGGSGNASGQGGATGGRGGSAGVGGGGVGGSAGAGAGGMGGSAGAPDPGLCNSATFGGHMYLLCREERTWPAALDGCTAVGMRLVRIDDAPENQWLFDNANTSVGRVSSVWIGATDQAVEGEWRWTDGTLFWLGGITGMVQGGLFAAWYFREPNNVSTAEHCASLETNGSVPEWYDSRCELASPFICESI